MQAMFDRLLRDAAGWLSTLIVIALILLLTRYLSRRSQSWMRHVTARTQAPPEIGDLLGRIVRIAVLAIGAVLVLGRLGFSEAVLSFVASLGIAGIIIGFALQDIVKQFAAGVLLLMLRPLRVGDEVTIGAFKGRVTEVQLRATVLKTAGGDEVLIPNADVYSTPIVNQSRYGLHRHDIVLTIPPGADMARARAAIVQAIASVPGVAANPAPVVVATGLEGQSVKLEARFWNDRAEGGEDTVRTGVVAAIRRALAQTDGETSRQGDKEHG